MNISKSTAITNSIVENYNKLSTKAKANMKPTDKYHTPVWGLNYQAGRTKGSIGAFGYIDAGKTRVCVEDGEVVKIKKPFFTTWKKALKKVNNMLTQMLEKFDDKKSVKQTQVNIFVARGPEVDKKIAEAQKRVYENMYIIKDPKVVEKIEETNKLIKEKAAKGEISLSGEDL